MRILRIVPTIYFVRNSEGLKQAFDLTLDNPGPPAEGRLRVTWAGNACECGAGRIAEGESSVRVYVPDVREAVEMTFELGGASATIQHRPQRHWTVHVVQFAHHDLGYTGLPSAVLKEFVGFYDDVLRFCRETDGFPEESKFRYTIEQGWSLLHWLDRRPEEAREEMMRRIKEGRIEVNAFVGNEVTELLGPEEMVRMLYPVFELKRRYGIPVMSAEHNDIPGVSWGAAAAMAGAGIRWFAPALPDYFRWGPKYHTFWDEDVVVPGNRPHAFWWEAPDGERVLFLHHTQGAGGPVDVRLVDLPQELEKLEETDYPYDVLRYQVCGAYRDNAQPRVEFAHAAREWNERWAYPRVEMSLNRRFFPELEKQLPDDLPVWRGELPGTDYSAAASCTAYPSSLNRVAHDWLLAGERLAAVASEVVEYEYPAETIDEAYYCALMNDEHAWGLAHPTGPGQDACIAQHCEFAYRAAALSHDIVTKAVNAIADRVQRDEDAYYAVVFNPLAESRTDVVAAPARSMNPHMLRVAPDPNTDGSVRRAYPVTQRETVRIPDALWKEGLEVIDLTTGKTVPHQVYEVPSPRAPVMYAPYRYASAKHSRAEGLDVLFVAEDVPAMGYKVYKFVAAGAKPVESGISVGPNTIENRFYRVELDPATGAISSIFDKELGRELVDQSAGHKANQLVLRSSLTCEVTTSGPAVIEQGRTGPVCASLVVKTEAEGFPQITQEIVLHSDLKRIDIGNRVLKDSLSHIETFFAFPFAFDNPQFRYEGSLCTIEPLVDQFPGSNSEYHAIQHWADVSDDRCGVAIASLDAPMMQFGGNWPLYISQAHHGVAPPNFIHPFHDKSALEKGHLYSFVLLNNYRTNFSPTQCGDLLFRYSITSHTGDWRKGRASSFGYSVSMPLVHAAVDGKLDSGLPITSSFVQIDKPNVSLVTLKRAQDGRGLIVRLMEAEGADTDVTVALPFFNIQTAFETNLVEEDLHPIATSGNSVRVGLKAWGIMTLRIA